MRQFVEEYWECRFQEMAASNDDGIDGMIFLSKHGEITGEVVYVQIKTGKSYMSTSLKRPDKLQITLGPEYIKTHRTRWDKYPGPVVLIWVDPTTDKLSPHGWWTDLKSGNSYDARAASYVLIDKKNRFGEHSKGHFKELCTPHIDLKMTFVETGSADFSYLNLEEKTKLSAHKKFRELAASPVLDRTNDALGEITVSRVFWKHITRADRRKQRILQSFQLLGAVLPVIKGIKSYENIGRRKSTVANNQIEVMNYVALRAMVGFNHRYQASVTVVLKRKRVFDQITAAVLSSKTWLYTIYENRRGKTSD